MKRTLRLSFNIEVKTSFSAHFIRYCGKKDHKFWDKGTFKLLAKTLNVFLDSNLQGLFFDIDSYKVPLYFRWTPNECWKLDVIIWGGGRKGSCETIPEGLTNQLLPRKTDAVETSEIRISKPFLCSWTWRSEP